MAPASGVASLSMFTITTLCSFYAGMRDLSRAEAEHCCQASFLVASWIVFALTFSNALIVLVMAFDKDMVIYPEPREQLCGHVFVSVFKSEGGENFKN